MTRTKRTTIKLCSALAATFLLAACGGHSAYLDDYHPPVRVPYNYKVKTFMDARPDDPRMLSDVIGERTIFPFHQDDFLQSLVGALNQQMFVSDEALLKVQLLDYAAVSENNTRSIAFYVGLEARNSDGVLLTSGTYSCLTNSREKFDVKGAFESLRDTGALTNPDREARKWLALYKDCLSRVAHEFNSEVSTWLNKQKYAD